MNNIPRQTLKQIIGKYGREIGGESKRCENLLNDVCGEYRREINVLVIAIDERVPLDLLAGTASVPLELLLSRLEKRLEEQTAMTREAARWAVESWALALNLATEADIEKRNEPVNSAPPVPQAKPIEPDDFSVNRTPPKSNKTIPVQPRPPIFVPPPKVSPPVVRQPSKPAPPTHSPTINQPTAPPSNQNQSTVVKRRFGIFRGCLFVFFLLAITSVVLFFSVPYAIEKMRETQRENNNQPPRFPVR